jgi:site-specific DNA-methyltransferase (adenine-specific)
MKPYYKNDLTTIYNGDCLEVMDYLIEQGVKVDAIITDPPYGTTACKWDTIIPLEEMWIRLKKLRKEKCPIVLFGSEPFSTILRYSNLKDFKYDWIWFKNNAGNFQQVNYQPLKFHEIASVFSKHNYYPIKEKLTNKLVQSNIGKAGKLGHLSSLNKRESYEQEYTNYPKSIVMFDREPNPKHPTQKPLELMKYLIETYTKKGDLILDFTAGSFTTCVGAEQLNRRSIGIELEKKYCDVGVKRLSQLQMRLDI